MLRQIHYFSPLLLVALVAIGCKVDQDKEVATYRKVLDAETAPPSFASGHSLTLEEAMRLANKDSEQLAIRGEDYLQALIDKDRATAAFLPTISLAPTYFTQDPVKAGSGGTGVSGGSQGNNRLDVPVTGHINVFNGFRDINNVYRAASTAEQRRFLLLDFKDQILIDVARTYYAVLRAERSVDVLRNSLAVQETRVRDMRGRQSAGIARPLDVYQTEALAASTRVSYLQAQTDVTNGRTTLAFLVNAPVADSALVDRFEPPQEPVALDQVLDAAKHRRRDYLAAQSAVKAAHENVQAAFGQYYPSVSVDVAYFLKRESVPTASDWNALLSANLPIFSAGLIEQDVRTAWSQLRQARLSESLTQRQVEEEVRIAYENYESNLRQVRELETQLQAAQEAFRQAEQSFNVGLATNLERLTAQDQLLSTQLQLTSAQFNLKVAFLSLLRTASALSDAYVEAQSTQPTTMPTTLPTTSPSFPSPAGRG
jgi:outer membrane protein TolC